MELRIAFVTYELVHGGSLTFLINISREFHRGSRTLSSSVFTLAIPGKEISPRQASMLCGPTLHLALMKDGITFALGQLRASIPTHSITPGVMAPSRWKFFAMFPRVFHAWE